MGKLLGYIIVPAEEIVVVEISPAVIKENNAIQYDKIAAGYTNMTVKSSMTRSQSGVPNKRVRQNYHQ